jgi:hypothetical protein
MPYLLYWFDRVSDAPRDRVTLQECVMVDGITEAVSGQLHPFVPFAQAVLERRLPDRIQKILIDGYTLSDTDRQVMKILGDVRRAAAKAATTGNPFVPFVTLPDYELYRLAVHTNTLPPPKTPVIKEENREKKQKKPSTAAAAAADSTPALQLPQQKQQQTGGKLTKAESVVKIGDRIRVYWDGDKCFYPGTVARVQDSFILIAYDDGASVFHRRVLLFCCSVSCRFIGFLRLFLRRVAHKNLNSLFNLLLRKPSGA